MAEKTKAYFISDMHLGAGIFERPREVEDRVVAFLDSIARDAGELYMLGDVLDYWYEYRFCVPRGFVRFFGALARLSDGGTKIYWYAGNHDVWLYDYLQNEIGLTFVDPAEGGDFRKIGSTLFYMGHGDGLGSQGLFMRTVRPIFRNRLCRAMYAAVHPRWTTGFALGCSRKSRSRGLRYGTSGARPGAPFVRDAADVPPMVMDWARDFAHAMPGLRYIVIGHHHLPVDVAIPATKDSENQTECRLLMLGAWNEEEPVYAVFDGSEMRLERFRGC